MHQHFENLNVRFNRSGARWTLIAAALGLVLASVRPIQAGVITTNYDLSAFTLVNANSDGTAQTFNSGASVLITGGNNGSGFPGTTDLVLTLTKSDVLQFHYEYSTQDLDPSFDPAFYLVGAKMFALMGSSGQVSVPVLAGDLFGFRVATTDNIGEPGMLTIADLTSAASDTPEPSQAAPLLFCISAFAAFRLKRRRAS